MTKLKLCPFCGYPGIENDFGIVSCCQQKGGCGIPSGVTPYVWNIRPIEDELRAEIERLEERAKLNTQLMIDDEKHKEGAQDKLEKAKDAIEFAVDLLEGQKLDGVRGEQMKDPLIFIMLTGTNDKPCIFKVDEITAIVQEDYSTCVWLGKHKLYYVKQSAVVIMQEINRLKDRALVWNE